MRSLMTAAALTLCATPLLAGQPQNFTLQTAQDLVSLCALEEQDPMMEAGRSFCYGYISGAHQYHQAIHPHGDTNVCLPEPKPTRAEAAAQLVAWAKTNTQYLQEPPIDMLFRFAEATWPCPKKVAKTKAGR